jgi:hypothetical protein
VNALPFCEELEAAVEQAFRKIREILKNHHTDTAAKIQQDQERLDARKHTLAKHDRNIMEMGLYVPEQPPLPLSSGN